MILIPQSYGLGDLTLFVKTEKDLFIYAKLIFSF